MQEIPKHTFQSLYTIEHGKSTQRKQRRQNYQSLNQNTAYIKKF